MYSVIIITGWNPGLDKIAVTKTIRKHTGFGLAEGKNCIDQILENKHVTFNNLSREAAESFLNEMKQIGAVGEIKNTDDCVQ